MYHIQQLLVIGSLTLFLAGCGGDEESADANKPKKMTVTPKAVAEVNSPKVAISVKRRPQPVGSKKQSQNPEDDALPPGVDPDDVFLTEASSNTFEVSATPEELATFTIVGKPAPGTDSGTFDLSALRSQRPAETPISPYKRPPRIAVQTGQVEETLEGLPEGFTIAKGSKRHESGLLYRIRNKVDDSEFVLIPAGNTVRGSQTGPANTQPEHQVYLDSYYISVHEVTLRQWELFRAAEQKNDRLRQASAPSNEGDNPEMPVLGIPQLEARKYAAWLHCELPTEAQWEKAARGPQGFLYPWGDGRPVWSRPRDKDEILPVKSWRNDVSTYGVYDLAGNAREWCLDVYRDDWYAVVAGEQGGKLVENPTGPKPGAGAYDRVIRGGGDDWKVWHREQARFSAKLPDVGFRLVVNLKPANEEAENEETGRSRNTRRGRN